MNRTQLHLGIDLGSISLKVVLVRAPDEILFERWVRVAGKPMDALSEIFGELAVLHPDTSVSGIGATGSGRLLVLEMIDAVSVNEISAQAAACRALCPDVKSIIEIGGQDSKYIVLEENASRASAVSDFRMNELCAAGTGAFLDQQAARLGMSIDEFAAEALGAKDPAPIAGRCAVFAKSDMTHHQQEGRSLSDIVAGLNYALVRGYLSNMVRGKKIPTPVSFQGAVAANEGLVLAFKKILKLGDSEFVVPPHHRVMGAIGAALHSAGKKTALQKNIADIAAEVKHACAAKKNRDVYDVTSPLLPPKGEPIQADFSGLGLDGIYLGIDMGSISVKIVALGPDGILHSDYRLSNGLPLEVLKEMMGSECMRKFLEGGEFEIKGAGITGSGRSFVGKLIGADVVMNEITAQALAAALVLPGADTVIEIGGQDAKFLRLDGRRPAHFVMNRVCAAGTGAFLQEQAKKLHVEIEDEFSNEAFASKNPAALGARCTVFMESDIVSHQQLGFSRRDLIAGLASSVVINYLEKVAAGHPTGEKILFIGGVAENRAVVSAMEAMLEKPVATSVCGKISGAIGAAVAAFEARKKKKYERSSFRFTQSSLDYEQFTCKDCPNSCRVTRTIEGEKTFGGRCGKWDGTLTIRQKSSSLVEKRLQLLGFERAIRLPGGQASDPPAGRADERRATRIGIPRALLTFDRMPLWREFFETLGCEVVITPPTDEKILANGMEKLVAETCLPVKAFCAHVGWLEQNAACDYIFIPSFINAGRDRYDRETVHCPYIQSLVQFAMPTANLPILNPVVSWLRHPRAEERAMRKIAKRLGFGSAPARRAWKNADAKLQNFRSELREIGSGVLNELENGTLPRAFVLLGKDYNICDPGLNSSAVHILESRGDIVITQDMIADDSGAYSAAYRTTNWTHAKEILAAAEIAAKIPGLYPVMITSFGCGPDAFTTRYVRDILNGKPFLLLEVDEHSSSVGMETRIEAFIDSLPAAPIKKKIRVKGEYAAPRGIKRVYLPNFSDHGLAFAAAIRGLGLTPVLTDLPDDESARLGCKHAASGECHPYTLMLGDYIKVAKKEGAANDACYYMPESGSCRVGQFGTQMRLVAEEMNLKLPVFTRMSELALQASKNSVGATIKVLGTFWQMMRGMDFLMQKFFETRAHEIFPGSTERAHQRGRRIMMDCIMEGRAIRGLKLALAELNSVEVDRSRPRVKIGITGDYYTRICDYANSRIFRDIERLGGVVMLSPTLTEFVKYDAHQKPIHSINHRRMADLVQWTAMRCMVNGKEKSARSIFGDTLDYDVPLDYGRATKLIAPYMDKRLPTGLTGSVAAIMEQIRAGADGILNIITFHCSYGLVLSSVLAQMEKDYPNLPKLTLIFEGLKPTHNRTRLEAFMERAREISNNRQRGPLHSSHAQSCLIPKSRQSNLP